MPFFSGLTGDITLNFIALGFAQVIRNPLKYQIQVTPPHAEHHTTSTSWNPLLRSDTSRLAIVFHRIPDQNRSEFVRQPSTTPRSLNASATFFPDGILRIPSSAHHFSNISRNADRDNPAPVQTCTPTRETAPPYRSPSAH